MEKFHTRYGVYYLGDARELIRDLDDESIKLIVTDPPWGVRKKDVYDDPDVYYDILPELYRVLQKDGLMAVYYPVKHIDRLIIETIKVGFKYYWMMIRLDIAKDVRSPLSRNGYCPIVLFYKKAKPVARVKEVDIMSSGEIYPMLLKIFNKETIKQFKSTFITNYIIHMFSEEGDTVLDPVWWVWLNTIRM